MDKTKCPKCKSSHSDTFLKPTLCEPCQELQKQASAKKKAEEVEKQLFKRSPSFDPISFKDLSSKKLEPGDVLVRNPFGWMFLPKGSDFGPIRKLISKIGTLYDWGGVGSLFLEDSTSKDSYLDNPKKISKPTGKSAWIYSYTPIGKVKELEKMWSSSSRSGFDGMIITTQKGVSETGESLPNEFGKHQLLMVLFKDWEGEEPDYYEDTASVLDCLAEGGKPNINLFWVRPVDTNFRDLVPINVPETNWIEQDDFLVKSLQ